MEMIIDTGGRCSEVSPRSVINVAIYVMPYMFIKYVVGSSRKNGQNLSFEYDSKNKLSLIIVRYIIPTPPIDGLSSKSHANNAFP